MMKSPSAQAVELAPVPTAEQKAELDKLLAEHEANPDDVRSWDEVEAAAIALMRQ